MPKRELDRKSFLPDSLFNNQLGVLNAKMIPKFITKQLLPLSTASTSKGYQLKWYEPNENLYIKEQFYYQNRYWKDYLVEVIASTIAKQLHLKNVRVCEQLPCQLERKSNIIFASYSKDFSLDGSYFLPFAKVNKQDNCFDRRGTREQKIDGILNTYAKLWNVDATEYLAVMFIIDHLVGNEDRHENNFGILQRKGVSSVAPLFDFGLGLFEHDQCYQDLTLDEAIPEMVFQPFYSHWGDTIGTFQTMFPDVVHGILNDLDLNNVELPNIKSIEYLQRSAEFLGIKVNFGEVQK